MGRDGPWGNANTWGKKGAQLLVTTRGERKFCSQGGGEKDA